MIDENKSDLMNNCSLMKHIKEKSQKQFNYDKALNKSQILG